MASQLNSTKKFREELTPILFKLFQKIAMMMSISLQEAFLKLHFKVFMVCKCIYSFPSGTSGKESTCNAGDIREVGQIPGSGRSSGGGNDNPLQCSCLENLMDRGAWWATVHRVTKSQTRLKRLSTNALMEWSPLISCLNGHQHFNVYRGVKV